MDFSGTLIHTLQHIKNFEGVFPFRQVIALFDLGHGLKLKILTQTIKYKLFIYKN